MISYILFSLLMGAFAPVSFDGNIQYALFGIDDIALAVAFSALIGGIVTAVTSSSTTDKTNQANLDLWEKQKVENQEQYERERLENRALIQEEREYNDPSAEKQRFLDAGINPTLAKYGGASSLSMVGVGQTPHKEITSPPLMQTADLSGIGNGISSAFSSFQDGEMKNTQMEAIKQDSHVNYLKALESLENSKVDRETKRFLQKQLRQEYQWNQETWDERMRGMRMANDSIFFNTQKTRLENQFQRMVNGFQPEVQANMRKVWSDSHRETLARINDLVASGNLKDAQAELAKEQKKTQEAITRLQGLSADEKDAMMDLTIDMQQQEYNEAYWNAINSRQNAGETSIGVGKYRIGYRPSASELDDPALQYHISHRDRFGEYFYDENNNKIYYRKNK